jgi:cytochrome oxidase Cu insertion factor (SCO1/SenC/PrrC family)
MGMGIEAGDERRWLHMSIMAFLISVLVEFLILFVFIGDASAHTPDWVSRLLEWAFGKRAAVGEAPSAGWIGPKPVPDFRLVDQDGQEVTLRELRGKVVLLNFIYTGCEDSCASMKELKTLARALGGRMGKEVSFVSISLNPEGDTPEALKAFGQRWGIGPGWKLLTHPSAAAEELASAYGVYVKRIAAGHKSNHGDIEYSDVILFVDQEGKLRKRVLPHLLRLSGRQDVEWLLEGHDYYASHHSHGTAMTMDELHAHGGVPPGWRFSIPPGDPVSGRKVFASLECYTCHEVKGEEFPLDAQSGARQAGPELTGMGLHHPAEYFVESILDPNAVIVTGPGYTDSDGRSTMPDYCSSLTVRQLIDFVAYLKSLGSERQVAAGGEETLKGEGR